MKHFADLLDRLSYTSSRNAKLRLIEDYLRRTPDPDRGWALAVLTDGLPVSLPVRRILGQLLEGKIDPKLYLLSRDYVGDTAETVALLWPTAPDVEPPPRLADVASTLMRLQPNGLPPVLEGWLDRLDSSGRWALLKMLTGALRVGVSARLAKTALAALGPVDVAEVEEVWHGIAPPYSELLAWLEGRGEKPLKRFLPVFRPMMLAHPIEERELAELQLSEFAVEWKWDGIRVQAVAVGEVVGLYSRTGDDIAPGFPEIVGAIAASLTRDLAVDGELLIVRNGEVAPFNDLQQRLNRKSVTRPMLERFPAHVRLYDLLQLDGEDLRALPFAERRRRLEAWHAAVRPDRTSLSALVDVAAREDLDRLWADARSSAIEGLMLKRRDSPYIAGRPRGHWYKWKRAALTLDCVLMYAQRGSGKRSSYYSDYTFGAWSEVGGGAPELVPVGKAYSGFTDEELLELDRWVRNHTIERFGPVRRVAPGLVLEVAFDAVHRSSRHKSGVAMRFPRIHRIRWDKPAEEADRLETLVGMIEGAPGA
jgi:DNA ligase-1